jgi:acetolactate synthase-1/2/3 large subunit
MLCTCLNIDPERRRQTIGGPGSRSALVCTRALSSAVSWQLTIVTLAIAAVAISAETAHRRRMRILFGLARGMRKSTCLKTCHKSEVMSGMTIQRLPTQDTLVPDAIINVLVEAGIKTVFGISGGHTGKLFAALARKSEQIRTVLVREESLAGAMAETTGRLTGLPGVMIGQGPWVLGNGLLGIIEAHLSSSPMLILTDFSDTPAFSLHAPYQQGTGDYGGWDARSAFKGVTKQVFQAMEAETAVHATQLAIKHALIGQPGPVAVLFSGKALQGKVGPKTVPRIYPTKHYLPAASNAVTDIAVEHAIAAIRRGKRPVLVAGNGVRLARAYNELQVFAERVDVPVVTTPTGKGCFPETHPLSLGVFGTFGTDAANACLGESDVVVIVGSKVTASDVAKENPALLDPERQTFIQVDVEERNASWTFPTEHVLIGDAKDVLRRVSAKIPSDMKFNGSSRVRAYRDKYKYFDEVPFGPAEAPISPRVIIQELARVLPKDAVVTCDAGENRILMTHYYRTRAQDDYIMASGAGPMGYAIPAALAAKIQYPERPVVAVSGDGGFSMTMNGFLTAIEQNIAIISVVFNNSVLGWSMHAQGPFANTFGNFDYSAIARGMGCRGVRISDPRKIEPELLSALSAKMPAVLDIVTSHDISFLDITSQLAKYP